MFSKTQYFVLNKKLATGLSFSENKSLCRFLMKLAPAYPNPYDPHLWEVFNTDYYIHRTQEHQKQIRHQSSMASYEYEQIDSDSWLVKYFFPRITSDELTSKVLLDLGSFTGGRLAAWTERFHLKKGLGLDIHPLFKKAGEEFAEFKTISNIEFQTGFGEALPYDDRSIDFIVSTDVFEHVSDVSRVLDECWRVLKPGGKLCVVFPQFLQPLESHLGLVTRMPALYWLFQGKTIAEAYMQILTERPDTGWYMPEAFPLREWEALFGLNGITISAFESYLAKQPWSQKNSITRPVLTDGRRSRHPIFRGLSLALRPLVHMRCLREYLLGRVNYVLTK